VQFESDVRPKARLIIPECKESEEDIDQGFEEDEVII